MKGIFVEFALIAGAKVILFVEIAKLFTKKLFYFLSSVIDTSDYFLNNSSFFFVDKKKVHIFASTQLIIHGLAIQNY